MKKTLFFLIFLTFSSLGLAAVPDIKLNDIKLTHVTKEEQYSLPKDKDQVLVVFWATWCPTCKGKLQKTLPEMQAQRKNLEIITVNTDKEKGRLQHYIDKNKVSIPVLRDEEKKLIKPLNIVSAPHWALFEKKGDQFALVDAKKSFDKELIESKLH